jgi:hypothetical protein
LKIVVSIDTEADNQWDFGTVISTKNIGYLSAFQVLCERYDIFPTYLITSEIALDPEAINYFKPLLENNMIEVGSHLHPWTTPPFIEKPGLRYNDSIHVFPSELSQDLLKAKIENLTSQIEMSFGKRPISFRAGRFGFNSICAKLLHEYGYITDSSITPFVSWKKTKGIQPGPDFSSNTAVHFIVGDEDNNQLLELPITILYTKKYINNYPLLKYPYSLLSKISKRLNNNTYNLFPPQPLWMRPFPGITPNNLIEVWKTAEAIGLKYVIMMFHSSEFMPGASIFRPDQGSVNDLLYVLENFFQFLKNQDSKSITLSDAAIEIINQNS